jgi:NAD(P)-dependent dehydrogenase (short-subunit alcohol dehydrogenase family)
MTQQYHDLRGKGVLVTGGSSGIGFAVARAFSENHARVAIVGRTATTLKRAARSINGEVRPFAFDLSDLERCGDLVKAVEREIGEIDVLVNNAGINQKKDALKVSNDDFASVVRINQAAVFALTREIGRRMLERGAGNVIMISSMASHYGLPKVIAYTASKSAVEGMTRALAVEWSPRVRVNCIAPGFIATDMSAAALDNDPSRKRKVLARTPMGRLGEPSDVANAALFLASDQSKYITGAVLPVDGGNLIGF